MNAAAPTAHKARTAPTERSIPPVKITSVTPMAMMPFSEAKRTMLSRLRGSRKTMAPFRTGERIAARTRMTINPNTLWKRSKISSARLAFSRGTVRGSRAACSIETLRR
jgi:hypothetical protein